MSPLKEFLIVMAYTGMIWSLAAFIGFLLGKWERRNQQKQKN